MVAFGKEIIINRMYNGEYLEDGNLGHEIINMYSSDNGHNYIYLNHTGEFAESHQGKVGAVILARTLEGKKMIEVLGLAIGIKDIYAPKQSSKEQKNFIRQNDIKYAGVYLDKLFQGNKFQYVYITFEAEKVIRPKGQIYISFNQSAPNTIEENEDKTNVIVNLSQNKQARASLKQYFDSNKEEDYNSLYKIVTDESYWGESVSGVSLLNDKLDSKKETLFDICRIKYSELAYSNALAYFIRLYPHMFSDFLSIKSNCNISTDIYVSREEANIDLLLREKNHIIVIENKIKSHINGCVFTRNKPEQEHSQLEKYHKYANKIKGKRQLVCILLLPDYNDINLSEYVRGEFYSKIFYSELYEFLLEQPEYKSDYCFRDFVDAMLSHTKPYSNDLYDEMKQLFIERIKQYSDEDYDEFSN